MIIFYFILKIKVIKNYFINHQIISISLIDLDNFFKLSFLVLNIMKI